MVACQAAWRWRACIRGVKRAKTMLVYVLRDHKWQRCSAGFAGGLQGRIPAARVVGPRRIVLVAYQLALL